MLSKEGTSELRNLQSQGVKASFPGFALFRSGSQLFWCVCHMYHLSKRHTHHQLQQVSLGWFCPAHGTRRESKTGNKQGRKAAHVD